MASVSRKTLVVFLLNIASTAAYIRLHPSFRHKTTVATTTTTSSTITATSKNGVVFNSEDDDPDHEKSDDALLYAIVGTIGFLVAFYTLHIFIPGCCCNFFGVLFDVVYFFARCFRLEGHLDRLRRWWFYFRFAEWLAEKVAPVKQRMAALVDGWRALRMGVRNEFYRVLEWLTGLPRRMRARYIGSATHERILVVKVTVCGLVELVTSSRQWHSYMHRALWIKVGDGWTNADVNVTGAPEQDWVFPEQAEVERPGVIFYRANKETPRAGPPPLF